MDEPTNDLDLETLDLLEALLVEFSGTLLLVSHDRAFLDNTVTSTLVFEGRGRIGEYVGGYSDWVRQRTPVVAPAPARSAHPRRRRRRASRRRDGSRSRSAASSRRFPDAIDARERERESVYASLSDPAVLRDGSAVLDARERLDRLSAEIEALVARWEELETIAAAE
jgi:ATP-binding cassette subfamily F protein uup